LTAHSAVARLDSVASAFVNALDRRFYPNYTLVWDDVVCHEMLLTLMQPQHIVLDVGAGAGINPHARFRGHAARVCGIDLDPRVMQNPDVDEARMGSVDAIPYPDRHFDIAFAWYVVEHLPEPQKAFAEVARTLKMGGVFVVKTPNLQHYVTTASRLLPHALHELIISRIFKRTSADIFPTVYRCNTERRIRQLAADAGFTVREIRSLEPRPEYVRFNPLTYLFGIGYERLVNASPALRQFRVALIAVLEKTSEPDAAVRASSSASV
jgi:ubiquinone/menaquinone biosynthesis C-methylase UbiE